MLGRTEDIARSVGDAAIPRASLQVQLGDCHAFGSQFPNSGNVHLMLLSSPRRPSSGEACPREGGERGSTGAIR